jgi:uncharacterized Zn-binding protein involved in type VI secretion
MGSPVARLGDTSNHGGTIITAASSTFINGKLAARKGDLHSCPIPGHGVTPITSGSDSVIVEGRPIARIGDTVGCGAIINSGSPDTLAG